MKKQPHLQKTTPPALVWMGEWLFLQTTTPSTKNNASGVGVDGGKSRGYKKQPHLQKTTPPALVWMRENHEVTRNNPAGVGNAGGVVFCRTSTNTRWTTPAALFFVDALFFCSPGYLKNFSL